MAPLTVISRVLYPRLVYEIDDLNTCHGTNKFINGPLNNNWINSSFRLFVFHSQKVPSSLVCMFGFEFYSPSTYNDAILNRISVIKPNGQAIDCNFQIKGVPGRAASAVYYCEVKDFKNFFINNKFIMIFDWIIFVKETVPEVSLQNLSLTPAIQSITKDNALESLKIAVAYRKQSLIDTCIHTIQMHIHELKDKPEFADLSADLKEEIFNTEKLVWRLKNRPNRQLEN